ncbi:MAG: DUF2490 domain-containing protein [Bryobacteraceae bacterium]|nr:DUF2490 domain-containing protein [Bryobacteraceae bacterium]
MITLLGGPGRIVAGVTPCRASRSCYRDMNQPPMDCSLPNHRLRRAAARMLLLMGLALSPAAAQTPAGRLHDHNFNAWLAYIGDHPVSGRWGVHLEGQFRRHDAFLRPQQLLLRPAVNYRLTTSLAASAGYAYVDTARYGEYPAQTPSTEHRSYQQISLHHKAAGMEFVHRGRNEQRWLSRNAVSTAGDVQRLGWRYQNRVRYMIRATAPLQADGWYLAFVNELFLNYAPLHGARVFDQTRPFVGVGRRIARDTRFEVGYQAQTVLQRNASVLEINHTLQIGITSRVPFRREAGKRK